LFVGILFDLGSGHIHEFYFMLNFLAYVFICTLFDSGSGRIHKICSFLC